MHSTVLVENKQDQNDETKLTRTTVRMTKQRHQSWQKFAVIPGLFPPATHPSTVHSILLDTSSDDQ